MQMLMQHYCQLHKSKFYRNEKEVNGETRVWYSHKILDGSGFCVEKESEKPVVQQAIFPERTVSSSKYMFMCNAMNNATALASGGRIEVNQIGSFYKKILSELIQTA